jgi:hypothetical protein
VEGVALSSASRKHAYFKMRMVGKGTYGAVHLVKCKDDGKVSFVSEFSVRTLRMRKHSLSLLVCSP